MPPRDVHTDDDQLEKIPTSQVLQKNEQYQIIAKLQRKQ